MPHARSQAVCGLITRASDGARYVAAAGGSIEGGDSYSKTMDLLNLETLKWWSGICILNDGYNDLGEKKRLEV